MIILPTLPYGRSQRRIEGPGIICTIRLFTTNKEDLKGELKVGYHQYPVNCKVYYYEDLKGELKGVLAPSDPSQVPDEKISKEN